LNKSFRFAQRRLLHDFMPSRIAPHRMQTLRKELLWQVCIAVALSVKSVVKFAESSAAAPPRYAFA